VKQERIVLSLFPWLLRDLPEGGKAGEAARDEANVQGWKSSKCSDSHLLGLVESHLLQHRNVIHWRRSEGESFPHEEKDESIVFLPYVLRGLGFPVSNFFPGPPSPLGGGYKCIT
jgi:hypothetical protein